MKKLLSIIFCSLLAVTIFSGCSDSNTENDTKTADNQDKIKIVTTIFPEYDWVKTILGDKFDDVELTMLLNNGVDLHSYQPTADDIIKISNCDMFIYVGGESDEWVEDALLEATNKEMVVINTLDVIGDGIKEEEIVEGMEADEKEDDETEYDEHVWLSLKNANIICAEIANKLGEIDTVNKEYYFENASSYIEKLKSLDEDYQKTVDNAPVKTLVFGDRFPFRYLVDDYELSYYAAFTGCSAETEASFETIVFLANKLDELDLKAIIQIESADGKIANTINNNTASKNHKILTMDSMQSTTAADIKNGVSYLSIMEHNLEILKEAIN